MNVRSITCFVNVGGGRQDKDTIMSASAMASEARVALESVGIPVQTLRLATQPLSLLESEPAALAAELVPLCAAAGFEYLSLGPILADRPEADLRLLDQLEGLICGTDSVFASVLAAKAGSGIHLGALRRTARIVHSISRHSDKGFGNLRLAVLSNVGPHSPFFPAAYHDGGLPALAIATESADLAVDAFSGEGSLAECQVRLIDAIETAASRISDEVRPLTQARGVRYIGIDFSLAPFPEYSRSIGAAVESIGVDAFGAPGTLAAAAMLTGCVRAAKFERCGFSGLMLPVLEDAVLAARSQEGLYTVNDLLLYSAVCGTGLDTVPLPGDVSADELGGILLDVASLALRLDKPLTARLMPIPGYRAGDMTSFDFEYFANGRILDVKSMGSRGLFERGDWLVM